MFWTALNRISIHALLAESDFHLFASSGVDFAISIHALLAESDATDAVNGCNPDYISIHALLAESDKPTPLIRFSRGIFLSTLSLRRATAIYPSSTPPKEYFYPRSPCGERQLDRTSPLTSRTISIHALLAESDPTSQTNLPGKN